MHIKNKKRVFTNQISLQTSGVTVTSLIKHSKETQTKTFSCRARTPITQVGKLQAQTSLPLPRKTMARHYLQPIHQTIPLQKHRTIIVGTIVRDLHVLADFYVLCIY